MAEFNELFEKFEEERKNRHYQMPSKKSAEIFIEEFINFLFPINQGRNLTKLEAEMKFQQLQHEFQQLLIPIKDQLPDTIHNVTCKFFESILDVYNSLVKDAETINKFDPASTCCEEVIVSYPGFFAITIYRITHVLYKLDIPILPRIISEYSHSRTGIDLHPGATIGENFFIDHGTGVVIGETATIKNNVKIYQGVTLGALSVSKDQASTKRHPTIDDNVIIYAGSTILGGETTIGKNSIIGGNCWLTRSVDPYSLVTNKSAVKVYNQKEYNEAISYVI